MEVQRTDGELRPISVSLDGVIDALQEQANELSPDAINACQVLGGDVLAFLSSPQGREFCESLRYHTYIYLCDARTRSHQLREEAELAEESLRITSSTFAFVEALTSRFRQEEIRRDGCEGTDADARPGVPPLSRAASRR
jgi:hypothetical protein